MSKTEDPARTRRWYQLRRTRTQDGHLPEQAATEAVHGFRVTLAPMTATPLVLLPVVRLT